MKVVINKRYGGFELSLLAKLELRKLGVDPDYVTRDDPRLVKIVKRLGPKANGSHAELAIVEIPTTSSGPLRSTTELSG